MGNLDYFNKINSGHSRGILETIRFTSKRFFYDT